MNVSLPKPTDRQLAIMDAMLGLVHQYGYSKITMDDLAKACGLSRPALYQFFKNKQEIYRAISAKLCDDSIARMKAILSDDGDPEDRLVDAILQGKLNMIAEMEATRHGAELMDLGNELSGDIFEDYSARIIASIVTFFSGLEHKSKEHSAEAMATNLIYWLEGMKARIKDPKEREKRLREFVSMQFAALKS